MAAVTYDFYHQLSRTLRSDPAESGRTIIYFYSSEAVSSSLIRVTRPAAVCPPKTYLFPTQSQTTSDCGPVVRDWDFTTSRCSYRKVPIWIWISSTYSRPNTFLLTFVYPKSFAVYIKSSHLLVNLEGKMLSPHGRDSCHFSQDHINNMVRARCLSWAA